MLFMFLAMQRVTRSQYRNEAHSADSQNLSEQFVFWLANVPRGGMVCFMSQFHFQTCGSRGMSGSAKNGRHPGIYNDNIDIYKYYINLM